MMNVAAAPGGSIPSHFAPPARSSSARRPLYHHPTLHMRPETSPRQSTQEFNAYTQPLPTEYTSPSTSQPALQPSPSDTITTPQNQQYPAHTHIQQQSQRQPPQRQPTAGSSNSLVQYIQPGHPPLVGHRRQTASTSTSNSSIIRIPSGQYSPSTPPILQTRPANIPPADTYVARLRRAKATVWSARGQREELDRSISKDDKYNKKYAKRPAPKNAKLSAGGPYNSHETGQYLPAHPRQLQPRLSANEVEDEDEIDPFISGPNFFDTTTTALSTKESVKTKTTTSSTSPSASARNVLAITSAETPTDSKSSFSMEDNRNGSPVPLQKYQQPVGRGQSRRVSRAADDDGVTERQVGGERRLFVVNASPSESEDDA